MSAQRQPGIDALKVLASQIIVWHHLATYGPVADALHAALPATMGWLYDYGRMAVQVFLVLGGFMAVHGLAGTMRAPAESLAAVIGRRYRRLVPPFAVAMLLAIIAGTLTRPWLGEDLAGAPPDMGQVLAHALLLHGVLDVESLSAGVWYVAVDFQLYALLAALCWLGQRLGHPAGALALVALSTMAALLWWNRLPALDGWALYFMGAYGLGALARAVRQAPDTRVRIWGLAGLLLLGVVALLIEWRTRMMLALLLALWLSVAPLAPKRALSDKVSGGLADLGRSSYALFLLHFPVLLLGNAAWVAGGLRGPQAALTVALGIWAVSTALGLVFEKRVETPLARWLQPRLLSG